MRLFLAVALALTLAAPGTAQIPPFPPAFHTEEIAANGAITPSDRWTATKSQSSRAPSASG